MLLKKSYKNFIKGSLRNIAKFHYESIIIFIFNRYFRIYFKQKKYYPNDYCYRNYASCCNIISINKFI